MNSVVIQDFSVRFTVSIPLSILERVRDLAYWERLGITDVTAAAFELYLKNMEQKAGIPGVKKPGKPYPKRAQQLRPGRRVD